MRRSGIEDAYRLLSPITGTAAAGLFFGIALLASGQSSTFTGTLAGQVVLEGFLVMRMPLWQRRLITRLIALVPAMTGFCCWGTCSGQHVGRQPDGVVFATALCNLAAIRANRDPAIMKGLRASWFHAAFAWLILATILIADLWMVCDVSRGAFQSR
jgi:manganese transport protein